MTLLDWSVMALSVLLVACALIALYLSRGRGLRGGVRHKQTELPRAFIDSRTNDDETRLKRIVAAAELPPESIMER